MTTLPQEIQAMVKDTPFVQDTIGMSDAQVLLSPKYVLKILPINAEADHEAAALRWLQTQLPVPRLLCCTRQAGRLYILMSRLPGRMACDLLPSDPTAILADALRLLWALPTETCPLSCDLTQKLRMARYNVEHGLVDIHNTEPETFGPNGFRDPEQLLGWLEEHRPPEELVFSHGDLCLNNFFVEDGRVSGFLDLGKAGLADRYQDLAICYRDLRHRTEELAISLDPSTLFSHLGLTPDKEKLRYYTLLDELF